MGEKAVWSNDGKIPCNPTHEQRYISPRSASRARSSVLELLAALTHATARRPEYTPVAYGVHPLFENGEANQQSTANLAAVRWHLFVAAGLFVWDSKLR
jgi:hypothetical protein